jgi:hypothetical protein
MSRTMQNGQSVINTRCVGESITSPFAISAGRGGISFHHISSTNELSIKKHRPKIVTKRDGVLKRADEALGSGGRVCEQFGDYGVEGGIG